MTLNKMMQDLNAWLGKPYVLRRLQRLSIIYGALFLVLIVFMTLAASGLSQGDRGIIGGDFLAFYTAGDMTLQGRALDAYQFEDFDAALRTRAESEHLGLMWQYPPVMFLIVSPLALLPYKLALWVWLAATALVFVAALRRVLGSLGLGRDREMMAMLLLVTSPLCLMVVVSGQISLLTAALLMTASFRPKQDWLIAGMAAGLLTIKPQLGVLLPLAYLLAGAWRAFGVAAAIAVLLHLGAMLIFGPQSLEAFLNAVVRLQSDVAGSGTNTPPVNMTTLFGQLRVWAMPASIAMPLHTLMALLVVGVVGLSWWRFGRSDAHTLYLAAVTGAGAILVTPYAYAYEMIALAPVALWLVFESKRLKSVAITLLTLASCMLIFREFLPLDTFIQLPFVISVAAFILLLTEGRRVTNDALIAP